MKRVKIILWLPFVILFFPLLILLGKERTDGIGNWIQDI
jgi:hypothetical protein